MNPVLREAELSRAVGAGALARGRAYARGGRVRSLDWLEDPTRLTGEVQGTARAPYKVTISFAATARGAALSARCTCPVGVNCKHAVAVLYAADVVVSVSARLVADRPTPRATPPATREPSWEVTLRRALDVAPSRVVPSVGLLFEVPDTASQRARGVEGSGPAVRLRPVTLGRSGAWITTGISWSSLDYYRVARDATAAATGVGLALLRELWVLSRLSSGRAGYGYHEDVWLHEIHSRRLWNLLEDARGAGMALLSSTRPPVAVDVTGDPAAVVVDLCRRGGDLMLTPGVVVDDAASGVAVRLLGRPAHGVVWSGVGAQGEATLHLRAFVAPLDETTSAILAAGPLRVPARDEARFFDELYPVFPRGIEVVSRDGSVVVPEPAPVTLVGHFSYHEGRLAVTWSRSRAGSAWRGGLDDGPPDAELDALRERVARAAPSWPGLVVDGPGGARLAEHASLGGVEAVRAVAEVVPAWAATPGVVVEWERDAPTFREARDAPVVRLAGSRSDDGDWFDLAVQVTVEGETVPFQELFVALAEGRSHLVLPSGTYFSLDRDDLRQLGRCIVEARSLHDAPAGDARLSRWEAGLWEDLCAVAVVEEQAAAWQAAVRTLASAPERAALEAPEGLRTTLRPYQSTGFNWLVFLFENGLGGVLADDMGLGKTVQALALVAHAVERGGCAEPFLVIAPTSVVANWESECRRFTPDLRVVVVSATQSRRGAPLADVVAGAHVVVTSYALFRLEHDQYAGLSWAGLFLDEAQFAKNRASKTYQVVKALPTPFKVAMTGTPLENTLMELWSLLSITAPGLFARADRFDAYYRAPIERDGDAERLAQLRRRLRPVMLRRTKEQVATDLPEKLEQVLELELHPRHRALYETYLARERQKVLGLLEDSARNRFEILRSITLLRQASLDVTLVDPTRTRVPSIKLDALMEMVEEVVADGHRVLIFSQFTRFLASARDRVAAAGIAYAYLDGRTRRRDRAIAAFREGGAPVFLISLKAGGFGLNLTEADYCVVLDPWWNPATEAQAVDRAHRIGQTRPVMVYRLVARDTIEERVMALKARKADLFENVMGGGEFDARALSAED
ncbi:MAG: SNF2-related protein, partial [Acidimicrobiales bacterium]